MNFTDFIKVSKIKILYLFSSYCTNCVKNNISLNQFVSQIQGSIQNNINLSRKHLQGRALPESNKVKEAAYVIDSHSKLKVIENKVKLLLSEKKHELALGEITECFMKKQHIPFKLLKTVAASASQDGCVEIIKSLKKIASLNHNVQYRLNFNFDNYKALALCNSNEYDKSLEILERLYEEGKGKKLKDAMSLVILKLASTSEKQLINKAQLFAINVAQKHGSLSPALTLWRTCFSSYSYDIQKVCEELVTSFPELRKSFYKKTESVISDAEKTINSDALIRLIQLLLHFGMEEYYVKATASLLKVYCELGDILAASETINFAMKMKLILPASVLRTFLVLLSHHKQPAPWSVLTMKYDFQVKSSDYLPYKF